jgi:hypothetical protein
MFIGVLLLLVGVLMLLERLNVITGSVWDYIFPMALVALGVSMIFRGRNRKFF